MQPLKITIYSPIRYALGGGGGGGGQVLYNSPIYTFSIAVTSSCQVGNNPAATSPVSTSLLSGTYLNTDHPVNCATENNHH